MSNNNDLEGITQQPVIQAEQPVVQEVEQPPELPVPEDPVEKFDVTRKARQEALSSLKEVMELATQGGKTNSKQIRKAFKALYTYVVCSEDLIQNLLATVYQLARSAASSEMNVFSARTHLQAVIKGLEKKGILKEEEIAAIHDKEILPEYLPKDMKDELEKVEEVATTEEKVEEPVSS